MNRYILKVKTILNKTDLGEKSKSNYVTFMKKIYILSGTKGFSFKFLKDVDNIKQLAEKESVTTAKMIYASIGKVTSNIKGFKKVADEYKKLTTNVNKVINEKYLDNALTDKQQNKLIPFNDLKKDLDTLKTNFDKKKNITNKKRYLIALMYLGSGFTPRLDYYDMKIIKNKKLDNGKDNFLKITKRDMIVILNRYKTHKQYGKITFKLPVEMVKELRRLEIENQEFLFESNKGGSYRKNKFSELIINTFNSVGRNKITLNDIRIIKESSMQSKKSYQELSQKERTLLHINLFQHSSGIAQLVYRKLGLEDN